MNSELLIIFDCERYRFSNDDGDVIIGTAVGADGNPVTIKAPEPTEGFRPGLSYRLLGKWSMYRDKKQFQANSAVSVRPFNREGITEYLTQCPHIGRVKSLAAWEKWGQQAVQELREGDAEESAMLLKLSVDQMHDVKEYLEAHKRREQSEIELVDLITGHGLPKKTVRRCIDEWGTAAAEYVRKNPYRLMDFPGIGFRRCDAMYLALGGKPNAMRRQVYCAWYGIAQDCAQNGNTWTRDDVAISCVKGMVGGTDIDPRKAIRIAVRAGILSAIYTDGPGGKIDEWGFDVRWLSDTRKAKSESELAACIADCLIDEPVHLSRDFDGLSLHQSEKVEKLLSRGGCLFVLGGGGGTGKSYTAAAMIKRWIRDVGVHNIAVCALAGKAAVRMTQAMSDHGIQIQARTVHATLGSNGSRFQYDSSNPLPHKVILVDEDSMLDTSTTRSLFRARGKGTVVVCLGDIHQLLPVGHGAPMRDKIKCGIVPYEELTEIRRNSGEVARQCKSIRETGTFSIVGGKDSNLKVVECHTADSQIRNMKTVLHGIPNPIWSSQVIVPTNKSGDLGRKNLNKILQASLNSSPEVRGTPFRIKDKVVCTKNCSIKYIDVDKETASIDQEKMTVRVANGDIGEVVECETKRLVVKLQSPYRLVVFGRSSKVEEETRNDLDAERKAEESTSTGCDWELAYALSGHKMQGSQCQNILVILDDSGGARRVCSREWFYTAMSRTSGDCFLIGRKSVALQMCRNVQIDNRKTFLSELIVLAAESNKKDAAIAIKQTAEIQFPANAKIVERVGWRDVEV